MDANPTADPDEDETFIGTLDNDHSLDGGGAIVYSNCVDGEEGEHAGGG